MRKRNDYKHIMGGVEKIPSTSAYEEAAKGWVSAHINSTADFLTKLGAPKAFIADIVGSSAIISAGLETAIPHEKGPTPVIPMSRRKQPVDQKPAPV